MLEKGLLSSFLSGNSSKKKAIFGNIFHELLSNVRTLTFDNDYMWHTVVKVMEERFDL